MTAFCDQCVRNDHESCMRIIGNLKLCRHCQINHPDETFIFGCKCGEWNFKTVSAFLDKESNFMKCPTCEQSICAIYPIESACDEYRKSLEPATNNDKVNHPAHYQSGGMEVIDVIEAFKLGFPLGNAVKYILRAGKKDDGLQDLQKAAWYINHEIYKIIESHSLKGKE